MESFSCPLWITPKLAIADSLAQFVALPSQSKLSRKKESWVVPVCMKPLAITVAVWQMDTLTASLVCFKIWRSDLSFRIRNWRWTKIVVSPDRILVSFSTFDCCALCSGARSDKVVTLVSPFSSVDSPPMKWKKRYVLFVVSGNSIIIAAFRDTNHL